MTGGNPDRNDAMSRRREDFRAVRRCALVAVVVLVACKDKPTNHLPVGAGSGSSASVTTADHPPPPIDAPPPPLGDWDKCKAGLAAAAIGPSTKRVDMLLAACHPCGDWTPLLTWQTLQEDGGPNRKLIESTMAGCNAWCSPNAKVRFMGALDDARRSETRTPWRELATQCKEAVSAVPDGRFLTAPYFAIDRIARWAGQQPGGPEALAAIDLPLPAITQTGVGVQLPNAPLTQPTELAAQLTVTAATLTIGTMPHAKLTPTGIVHQGDVYPGALVTLKDLSAKLDKLGGKAAIFAPPNLPAARIQAIAAAAGAHVLVLAAASKAGPLGWEQHGVVPVSLTAVATPRSIKLPLGATADDAIKAIKAASGSALVASGVTIVVGKDATVAGLVTVLGALGFFELPAVTLVLEKAK